jgi:hypothetical protein
MSTKLINITLQRIDLVSKSIEVPPANLISPDEISFNFVVDIKLGAPEKLAVVVTDISILWPKEDNKRLAFFKTVCVFHFPGFDEIFTAIEDGRYEIPFDIEVMLKTTGLSTTRGMIYSDIKGTYLHGALLPLVDINKIIRDDREKAKNVVQEK